MKGIIIASKTLCLGFVGQIHSTATTGMALVSTLNKLKVVGSSEFFSVSIHMGSYGIAILSYSFRIASRPGTSGPDLCLGRTK